MRPFSRWFYLLLAGALGLPTPHAAAQQTPAPAPKHLTAALPPGYSPVPLDAWLTSPTLWQTSPEQFPAARDFRFRWVSTAHDAARTDFPALRLHDLPVAEVITRFSPGNATTLTSSPGVAPAPAALAATAGHTQLSGIQISIYNRGDVGDLGQKSFDALVAQSKIALSDLTGTTAAERVLRYYRIAVDQNELAQIANTATEGGTSTDAMLAALKKLASRLKVNVITEVNPSYQDFLREIDDYNRVARNAPKASNATLIDTRATPLSYDMVYEQMQGDLLRDARTKLNPAYMTRFEHDIQARLDRGIPLLWSVALGLLPEEKLNPQARGGHMRLIIGYNAKTKEVYYSDTWGIGHELKKMPLANAWTITTGLFTLEPI